MTRHNPTQARQRIIFRADGNSRIGLGHVTRSLALAHMLRDEFECVFAIQSPDAILREQVLTSCQGIIALPPCEPTEDRFMHELAAYVSEEEIVVLDGYHFNTRYQQNIKARGAILVCIDDIHSHHFVADAVLNPAGGVMPDNYSIAPYTKLYTGPAYALLRPPFLEAARSSFPQLNTPPLLVLICMGGADPDNHTLRITEEILKLGLEAEVNIVTGSAYQHTDSLNTWLARHPQHRVHQNLSATAMCELMRSCPVAITSASGVAYEYAAVGGALFIHQTATNQQALYHYLLGSGMAKDYSYFSKAVSTGKLEEIGRSAVLDQRKVFDGQSGDRLRSIFKNLGLQAQLTIRPVVNEDLQTLFEWANDPVVRSHSFNTAPIPIEVHTSWFTSKLNNPDCILYMVELQDEPAAHIRFEISEASATISYLIGKECRGKGLGHSVLLKGIKKLLKERSDVRLIDGLVQKSNAASLRAFEKAGFHASDPDPLHPEAIRFRLEVR